MNKLKEIFLKTNKPLLIVEILVILLGFIAIFILDIFRASELNYVIFWFFVTTCLVVKFGFNKDKHLYKVDIIQTIFIFTLVYIMATYLLGFVTGFVENPRSMALLTIKLNLLPVLALIVLQEISRYVVITKGNKINIILITIVLMLMPIFIDIGAYNLRDGMEVFEAIGLLILPSIINSLLLTYIVIKVGYRPAIIYRVLLILPLYLIPFLPDLGPYLQSILFLLFPTIVFLKINAFFGKIELGKFKNRGIKRKVAIIPAVFVLLVVVALTSGLFKYYLIAVGSNSMYPEIRRGDALIVQRLSDEEIEELEPGIVIVYRYEGRLTIHRLVDVEVINDNFIFQTKGDNNPDEDDYYLRTSDIEGIAIFRIPFIGYPSIILNE